MQVRRIKMQDNITLHIDEIGITDKSYVFIIREPNASKSSQRDAMEFLQDNGWIVGGKVDTVIESKGNKIDFLFTMRGNVEVKNNVRGNVYSKGNFECAFEKRDGGWNYDKITCTEKA